METKLIATVILLIAVTLSAFNNMSFIKQTANAQVSLGDLTNQWWDWIFSLDIVKLAQ